MNEVELRRIGKESITSIKLLHNLAFQNPSEGNLVELLMHSAAFIPELSIGAYQHKKLVGHLLLSEVILVSEMRTEKSLSLAPMAVLPGLQKQGIGSRMVEKGIALSKRLKYNAILVLGHAGYYPRFGFRKASKFAIKCPWPAPDEAWMVLELSPGSLRKGYTVTYPEAFFTMD